jgi:hypothetical protein
MNFSVLAPAISAVAAIGAAGAALWGLRYGKGLIDSAVNDRRVDRVLAMHQDFTSGEVGAARIRFCELMYRVGEEAFGPRKCWRPDWESLIPPNPAVSEEVAARRFLGSYPADMTGAQQHRPIHDLRQVLWCVDRINEARKRETSLDERLLVSLMGHPVVWLSLLCGRLEVQEAGHLGALRQLAGWMEECGWRTDPHNSYRKVPEDDFPGDEDQVAYPGLATSPAITPTVPVAATPPHAV